ncbi:MAG TPA: sugar phosphate isomerase/epimerase [Gemmatimonadaceae bacterium]|nr:sugar phosphate isomerase/epimerase [Gemmatimonadaceae bacterium]
MRRRAFLHTIGASAAGLALTRHLPVPGGRRLARVGLELYSVRNAMKRDPEGTLAAVRAIGYDDVELLWAWDNFGQTAAQVRATLGRLGLRAPSAHIAPELLVGDWEKSLETATYLGHRYLIVPSLPDETKTSLDAWRHWADVFNTAGAAARKAGIWLAQHNEPEHVHPIDGQVPYDLFIARTDPAVVRLQLDFGNMAVGGGDPMAYLTRYRDRYWSFHVKDVVPDRSHDTELGAGVLDLKALLGAIPDLDHKPCYVEQESPADELASAKMNYTYLSQLAF